MSQGICHACYGEGREVNRIGIFKGGDKPVLETHMISPCLKCGGTGMEPEKPQSREQAMLSVANVPTDPNPNEAS